MSKYNIGDGVYIYRFHPSTPKYIPCTCCGGHGAVKVTFYDGQEVSINCEICNRDFLAQDDIRGFEKIYVQSVEVEHVIISGKEESISEPIKYKMIAGTNSYWLKTEEELFDTEEDAKQAGLKEQEEYQQKQLDDIYKKEHKDRKWSWNASYHRREIKDLTSRLEYHKSKLAVASLKAKEDKNGK
jgi:hypothetical protein